MDVPGSDGSGESVDEFLGLEEGAVGLGSEGGEGSRVPSHAFVDDEFGFSAFSCSIVISAAKLNCFHQIGNEECQRIRLSTIQNRTALPSSSIPLALILAWCTFK